MPVLVLDAVRKHYGVKPLLDDVSFSLEDAGKMGVIGANGSGKTTLLRIIAGVEAPDAGRVLIPSALRTGYLPQVPLFAPGQTVLDAVFAGEGAAMRLLRAYEDALHHLETEGSGDARLVAHVSDLAHQLDAAGGWDLETNARAVLDHLGITDTDAPVETLSGGQRQAVAVARAAAFSSKVIILDEPTAALGVKESNQVLKLIESIRERGLPVILVSHNMPQVFEVADRIHIQRLGKRAAVVSPKTISMADAVAVMTGAIKVPPSAQEPVPEA